MSSQTLDSWSSATQPYSGAPTAVPDATLQSATRMSVESVNGVQPQQRQYLTSQMLQSQQLSSQSVSFQQKRLSECSNVSSFQIPPDTGSGSPGSNASFHVILQSELEDFRARLAAGYARCVATLERENAKLLAESAKMSIENSRLRASLCGGDPDSAAGSPMPRPRSPSTSPAAHPHHIYPAPVQQLQLESPPSSPTHPLAPAPPAQPVQAIRPASPSTLPPALDVRQVSPGWMTSQMDALPTAPSNEPAPEVSPTGSSLQGPPEAAQSDKPDFFRLQSLEEQTQQSAPKLLGPSENRVPVGPAIIMEHSPPTSEAAPDAVADSSNTLQPMNNNAVQEAGDATSAPSAQERAAPDRLTARRPSTPSARKRPSTPARGAVHEVLRHSVRKNTPGRQNPMQNNDPVRAMNLMDEEDQSEVGDDGFMNFAVTPSCATLASEAGLAEYTVPPQIQITEPPTAGERVQSREIPVGSPAEAGSGMTLEFQERASLAFDAAATSASFSASRELSSQLNRELRPNAAASNSSQSRKSLGNLPPRMRVPERLQVANEGRSRSGSMASVTINDPATSAWKSGLSAPSRRQSRLGSNSRRNSELMPGGLDHRRDSIHSRVSFLQQNGPDISEVYVDDENASDNGSVTGLGLNSDRFWKTYSTASGQSQGSDDETKDSVYELLPVWKPSNSRSMRRLHSKKSELFTQSQSAPLVGDTEKEQTGCIQHFMIHPSSLKHICWDFLGLLFIGYDCIVVPLEVFNPPEGAVMDAMLWILRVFWTLNILVCFLTGVLMPEGTVEMAFNVVAKRYICTWFAFDVFLSTFDWVEVSAGQREAAEQRSVHISRVLRGMRMFRTVRVIRLMKTPEFVRFVTENIRSEEIILSVVIIKIMIVMFMVAHFLACTWYGIARLQEAHNTRTWLEEHGVREVPFGQKYAWAFHWSLSQFSGEALISPQNSVERSMTVTVLFFCFMFSTYIVSSITTSITRIQLISNQQSAQTAALRRYLSDNRISRALATRVENNAQFAMAERKRNAPESSIDLLKVISEPLLVELHFEIHFVGLSLHPFFYYYHDVNPAGIRKLCNTAVSRISFSRGDVLFSDNEVMSNPRMFFLLSGQMLYTQDGKDNRKVYPGEWLCEPALWTSWTHAGTLHCVIESRLTVIDARMFQDVISNCHTPEPALYGSSFVKWLNRLDKQDISDVGENDHALHRMMLRAFPIMPIEEDEDDADESDEDDEGGVREKRHKGPWERQYSMSSRTSQNGTVIQLWWWKFTQFAGFVPVGSGARGSQLARFSSSGRRRGSNELKHLDYRGSTISSRSMTKAKTGFVSKILRAFISPPSSPCPSPTGSSSKDKQLASIVPSEENEDK